MEASSLLRGWGLLKKRGKGLFTLKRKGGCLCSF
jgi:hypothetical protein